MTLTSCSRENPTILAMCWSVTGKGKILLLRLRNNLSKIESSKSGKLPPNRLKTRGRIALGGHAQGVWLRSMHLVPLN